MENYCARSIDYSDLYYIKCFFEKSRDSMTELKEKILEVWVIRLEWEVLEVQEYSKSPVELEQKKNSRQWDQIKRYNKQKISKFRQPRSLNEQFMLPRAPSTQ